MYEFYTKQNKTLLLDIEQGGVTFSYVRSQKQQGHVFQVAQSWAGVHALLSKLRRDQKYSANDNSLSVWVQNQELSFRFHASGVPVDAVCTFSPEETAKIFDFLERSPNLN